MTKAEQFIDKYIELCDKYDLCIYPELPDGLLVIEKLNADTNNFYMAEAIKRLTEAE